MYNGYAITIPCRSPVYPCAPGPAESSSPPSPSVAAPRTVPAPAWPPFKARRAVLPLLELFLLPSPATLPPHLLLLLPIIISSHTTPNSQERKRREREKKVKEALQIYFWPHQNSVQKRAEPTKSQVPVSSVLSLSISSYPFLFFSIVFSVPCTSFCLHESKRICYFCPYRALSPLSSTHSPRSAG
ncbi:hypothetical protein PVAP13_3KG543150 [Panicum virgatum]|uniref:Uncharacterized protein n=1 Tax=Panicum virgatum TaxID=38727 RepID=A0A8T0VD16_PANVG|nr:hypothetical protein PVAP13_3KG543150 [Panicum virgatum]